MSIPAKDETWQMVVHPAATDGLVGLLAERGLHLQQIMTEGDDLPTYVLVPAADYRRLVDEVIDEALEG